MASSETQAIVAIDVAQADAALAAARASLASAEGSLQVARESYLLATGKMPGKLAPPPPTPKLPANLAAARDIGQRTHPSIEQARREAAAAELAQAQVLAPSDPAIAHAQAVLYAQAGDWPRALAAADRLVGLASGDAGAAGLRDELRRRAAAAR